MVFLTDLSVAGRLPGKNRRDKDGTGWALQDTILYKFVQRRKEKEYT
jgi:hypothetical protein